MKPVKAIQQTIQIDLSEIVFCDGAVLAVICDLAWPDTVARFQIIGSHPMCRCLLRCAQNHRRAMDIIAAQHPYCTFAQAIIGDHTEKSAVDPQIGQGQRNIGFAAAVAYFKRSSDPYFIIVWRR